MIRTLQILALMAALAAPALAQDSLIPAEVYVGTEPTAAAEFTIWTEKNPVKYSGTYAGEVGGDSSGELVIKVVKAKNEESPATASGTFTHTIASTDPTVLAFENAFYWGDPEGVFTLAAFNIIFVKYGETPGAIVGNLFIPKAASSEQFKN